MKKFTWFDIDKQGMLQFLDRKGRWMAVFELIQNSWDTEAETVRVLLEKIPGRAMARLRVEDDNPEGFKDLRHSYTLFAPSEKKDDPTKRGFMNVGEKFVLALCDSATIRSTKGTVTFHEDGTRQESRRNKTDVGTVVEAEIRMTTEQLREAATNLGRLVAPEDIETHVRVVDSDGTVLRDGLVDRPELVAKSHIKNLPTRRMDAEGNVRPTTRSCDVHVYRPRPGETDGAIYEMGLPVVVPGDGFAYHVDVQQKVPVNMERDNVPPAYLRRIQGEVLRLVADELDEDTASQPWVAPAMEDDAVDRDTADTVLDAAHGEDRTLYDGADTEANHGIAGRGGTVIPRGSMSPALRKKLLDLGVVQKSGDVLPTPRPYSDDPDATPVEVIHPDNWTEGMGELAEVALFMAEQLHVADDVVVRFVLPKGEGSKKWRAAYGLNALGVGTLDFNVTVLGKMWIHNWFIHIDDTLNLLIHELAHHDPEEEEDSVGHLDQQFHKNATRIGAALAVTLMLDGDDFPFIDKIRAVRRSA
jgi:hypothetical protein